MKIKVNPLDPTFLVTTFYGPTRLVEKYRTIYSEKVNDWNADDDIHGNFLKIFGKYARLSSHCRMYWALVLAKMRKILLNM